MSVQHSLINYGKRPTVKNSQQENSVDIFAKSFHLVHKGPREIFFFQYKKGVKHSRDTVPSMEKNLRISR